MTRAGQLAWGAALLATAVLGLFMVGAVIESVQEKHRCEEVCAPFVSVQINGQCYCADLDGSLHPKGW